MINVFLIFIYSFIVICGLICLIFDITNISKNRIYKKYIYKTSSIIFEKTNFSVGIFCAVIIALNIVFSMAQVMMFFVIVILTMLSFIIEKMRENINKNNTFKNENNPENKLVFSMMNIFSELKIKNHHTLTSLLEKQNDLKVSIERYFDEKRKIMVNIDDYVKMQKTQCSKLLEKRDKCEIMFQELERNAKTSNDMFGIFKKNLNSIDASFKYYNDSDTICNDLKYSFHVLYTHRSEALMREIDDCVSKLNNIFLKCTNFTDYLKPYFQTINIYSSRIETTIKYFEDKNLENIKNNNDFVKICEIISETITKNEMKMDKIMGTNELYLNKNLFVLSKILETYKS
jgi:hypothetical protein